MGRRTSSANTESSRSEGEKKTQTQAKKLVFATSSFADHTGHASSPYPFLDSYNLVTGYGGYAITSAEMGPHPAWDELAAHGVRTIRPSVGAICAA